MCVKWASWHKSKDIPVIRKGCLLVGRQTGQLEVKHTDCQYFDSVFQVQHTDIRMFGKLHMTWIQDYGTFTSFALDEASFDIDETEVA